MAHIGVLIPGALGHLNPASCLGRELQTRGHRVTIFQVLDLEDAVRRTGLEYRAIGEEQFPRGRYNEYLLHLGTLKGLAALRYTIWFFAFKSRMLCAEAPHLIRELGIDLLLVDEVEPAGSVVAEHLRLPYLTLSNALTVYRGNYIPPVFTTWAYSPTYSAKIRNMSGYLLQRALAKKWLDTLNLQRREWRLSPYRASDDFISPWGHLTQQPPCFDFPREHLPEQFHYTGPWHDIRVRPPVLFPFEKLDGRPLIYASMGTLQNQIQRVFQEIACACEGLDAQLVISLGGGAEPGQLASLPGNPLVVSYAPQLELLSRAALTITHAGLNTVLESLSNGVPMVAIPVGNDQPGVAARVKWLGAGELLPLKRLRADRLRPLVKQVLEQEQYRLQARRLMLEIKRTNGVERASDLIEQLLYEQRPVLRAASISDARAR
jgi:zeaxanthin glucosyltransferase